VQHIIENTRFPHKHDLQMIDFPNEGHWQVIDFKGCPNTPRTGKQRPPPAYLALADGVAAAREVPREEVPQEVREELHDEGPRARTPDLGI
jgi:hypothetical protein